MLDYIAQLHVADRPRRLAVETVVAGPDDTGQGDHVHRLQPAAPLSFAPDRGAERGLAVWAGLEPEQGGTEQQRPVLSSYVFSDG